MNLGGTPSSVIIKKRSDLNLWKINNTLGVTVGSYTGNGNNLNDIIANKMYTKKKFMKEFFGDIDIETARTILKQHFPENFL